MAYKTILTHLDGANSLESRVVLAANMANRHRAHLLGIAPVGIAILPGDAYLSVSGAMLIEMQAELDKNANDAVLKFNKICQGMDVQSFDATVVKAPPSDALLLHCQHNDLVVLSQAETKNRPAETSTAFVERVLLGAGKPVVVVPHTGHCKDAGKRVLLAWDGSRESVRATTDAMPILTAADTVEMLMVSSKKSAEKKHEQIPGSDIGHYLARHGVNVVVRELVSDIDIGETLLSHAADFGADLLVMGGYGHSRLREWVMGGATRAILNSMTVPVLMSH